MFSHAPTFGKCWETRRGRWSDRRGWRMKRRMSRQRNRWLQRKRRADRTPGASSQQQRVWWPGRWYTTLWPSFSLSTLSFPCKPLLLWLFVSCEGRHVQKEQICRMALILLLWFFHLPHPSLCCSHPSTCFKLGQRRGGEKRKGGESWGEEERGEKRQREERASDAVPKRTPDTSLQKWGLGKTKNTVYIFINNG